MKLVFFLGFQDSRTEYNKKNIRILIQDDEMLQFMAGVKVVTNDHGEEELWILTNRFQVLKDYWTFLGLVQNPFLFPFQKFMTGYMVTTEPNFCIFAVLIKDLLREPRSYGRNIKNL